MWIIRQFKKQKGYYLQSQRSGTIPVNNLLSFQSIMELKKTILIVRRKIFSLPFKDLLAGLRIKLTD